MAQVVFFYYYFVILAIGKLRKNGAGDAGVLEHPDVDLQDEAAAIAWELSSSDEEVAAPKRAPRPPRCVTTRPAVVAASAGSEPGGGPSAIRATPGVPRVVNVAEIAGQRANRVDRWPRLIHSDHGGSSWLRISHGMADVGFGNFRAACGICGATLDKSGRRHRPLGELWSWLALCPGPADREAHRRVPSASFADRAAARRELESLPGAEEFCEGEAGGAGSGEPAESFRP